MTTDNTMDPRKFITGSNVIQIARGIQNEVSLDNIKALLHKKESRLSLNDLSGKPAFDPNAKIPKKINSNTKVLISMLPFSAAYTKTTTFYDIYIENYNKNRNEGHDKKAEDNIKVFKLLLEQRQPKENFAELVVKLVDYAESNPRLDCELLDVMEKHKDKINFNQNVFVSKELLKSLERSDANNNDVSKPPVSSSDPRRSGLLSLPGKFTVLCQQSSQPIGVTMPLGKFLSSVSEVPGNKKIAAFAEAIMPSKNFVDPNLTQPKEL